MNKVSRSRVFGLVLCGLLGSALAQSCTASEVAGDAPGAGGTGAVPGNDANNDVIINPPGNGGDGGQSPYSPLCGIVDCVPDLPNACPRSNAGSPGTSGEGGAPGGGGRGSETGGTSDGAGRPAGGRGDGGGAGESGQGASGNAGGRTGEAGSSSTGARGGTGTTEPTVNSCQVRPKGGQPRAQCVPAGSGQADAPCLGGSDCAPGLACVQEGDAGQCRPYCCDESSCADRTHCFERNLFSVTPTLAVPVCVPAVDCGLAEPFPCPQGATCSCPAGTACMVVGADRSTTCLEPGAGREGFACPCYHGYVCSEVTNRCVKLCETTAPEKACATGMCQVAPELPVGWGVCVGTPRPDAG